MSDEQKKLEEKLAKAPLELEITDAPEPEPEESVVEESSELETPTKDEEFSKRVQKRISSLVQQRKQAEAEAEAVAVLGA